MSTAAPEVVVVAPSSPAERAGLRIGDRLVSIDGRVPRDVIDYQVATEGPDLELVVERPREGVRAVVVRKAPGEPLGLEVSSAVFDRVRTCDNHCAFCFIHQLPPGMRRSLSLKDDDFRLSFLYGNFTTLTRFTEMDLERVLGERLSPLFVSIHATDPDVRAGLLRNRRGATSLRWLRALLDGGIEVHGQIVVCPGVNDGPVLEDTMIGILDRYPELASVACVPLGVSHFTREPQLRPHSRAEAAVVCDLIENWQSVFLDTVGRRLVFAADEYYLMAGRAFPDAGTYEGYPQHENGVGMARAFEAAFAGDRSSAFGVRPGFFAWVDGAPPSGYRARRSDPSVPNGNDEQPVAILTGEYGARVLAPLMVELGRPDVRIVPIVNAFFGGNIAVAGLLTGTDLATALECEPVGHRYLIPDACLSEGRFLDDLRVEDLPRPVQVVPTDGASLRAALDPLWRADRRTPIEPDPVPVPVVLGGGR